MNISKISFGSTYTIQAKDNTCRAYSAAIALYPKEFDQNSKIAVGFTPKKEYRKIAVDEKYDKKVESYLRQNNIVFTKKTNEELFNIDSIKSRIRNANIKYDDDRYLPTTININVDNFEKIFKNSWQYVGDKKFLQNNDKYNGVRDYLKLDLPIDAPEVYITEHNNTPKITFADGRHRYAFFRDLGMKNMPVSMNYDTFKKALKYGIVK